MNKFFLLFSFAVRDISKSRVILILTIISLSAAFTSMFMSSSILEGFGQMLEGGVIDYLGHVIILPPRDEFNISNAEEISEEVRKMDNVESVSVRSYAIAGIKYKDKFINPHRAIGFDFVNESQTTELPDRIVQGKFISRSDEVVLGLTLADALVGLMYDKERVDIGEEIEVFMLNGTAKKYKISGIIDAKTFLPNWLLIFNKEELEFLDNTQKNSEIIVRLKDSNLLDETISTINDKGYSVHVASWREEAGYISDIMEAVNFVTGSINKLLILSVFLIVSIIIFINVFQRRRQIGVIKSMGGNNKFVIMIFVLETIIYSVFSYILGFLIFMLIYFYSLNHPIPMLIGDFTMSFNIQSLLPSIVVLFVAAIGGSFIPAYIAGKTKVIDVLRGNI